MEMYINFHWAQLTTIYYIFKMSLNCLTNGKNMILFTKIKMRRWYKRPTFKQFCTSVYLKLCCSINIKRCRNLFYHICYIPLFWLLKMINYAIKPSKMFGLQNSIHTSQKVFWELISNSILRSILYDLNKIQLF